MNRKLPVVPHYPTDNLLLHLIPESAGGICQHVKTIVTNLGDLPSTPVVAGPAENILARELLHLGVSYIPLNYYFNWPSGNVIRLLPQLIKLFMSCKPQLIHCHGHKLALIARLALGYTRATGTCSSKAVVTVHNFSPPLGLGRFMGHANKFLDEQMLTGQIIAVSRNLLEQEISPKCHHKAQVIYNGIHLNHFPYTTGKARLTSPIKLGVVARLAPQKGIIYLIHAMAKLTTSHPELILEIIGSGPEKQKLVREAELLGLAKKVIFREGITNVQPYLVAMDIFVVPSISEGLSIATIEAMATGKPIVASNTGGLSELILHGQTGYLVPPANSDALAKAIGELIANWPQARAMGKNAALRAEDFCVQEMLRQTKGVYEKILLSESN